MNDIENQDEYINDPELLAQLNAPEHEAPVEPSLATKALAVGEAVAPAVATGALFWKGKAALDSVKNAGTAILDRIGAPVSPTATADTLANVVKGAEHHADTLAKLHDIAIKYKKAGLELPDELAAHLSDLHSGSRTALQSVGIESVKKLATSPESINTAVNVGENIAQKTVANRVRDFALSKVAGMAPYLQVASELATNATPAQMFAMPYQAAAHEQQKIRANPNAPEYTNNPYAMVQRGEAQTQGQAGAINRRRALSQLPSLSGPIPPGAQ